jgi:hypothetical protein
MVFQMTLPSSDVERAFQLQVISASTPADLETPISAYLKLRKYGAKGFINYDFICCSSTTSRWLRRRCDCRKRPDRHDIVGGNKETDGRGIVQIHQKPEKGIGS